MDKSKNEFKSPEDRLTRNSSHVLGSPMPQIGSVPYLNALPLLEGLETSTRSKLLLSPPATLHEAIAAQKIEVALLPVVSYLENHEFRLVPGTGICCNGAVRSVRVFFHPKHRSLETVDKVYLDPHSKTSQRLLKVLLAKKYERNLHKIEWVDQLKEADCALQIGDKALINANKGRSIDLGTEWYEFTGLPFVFACWMSRGPVSQDLLAHLHNAKMNGKQNLEAIAQRQKIVSPHEALDYLTQCIHYDIEGPELVGMKLFFDWVGELENQVYDTSLRFVA